MNKKILLLVSFLFFLLPFSVFAASAGRPLTCCELRSDVDMGNDETYSKGDVVGSPDEACYIQGEITEVDTETSEWGLICLLGTVGGIASLIFIFLMVVSPLMIIFGAYNIMTSGGEPEKVSKGKNFIIWAAAGMIIGLFANVIPNLVTSLLV